MKKSVWLSIVGMVIAVAFGWWWWRGEARRRSRAPAPVAQAHPAPTLDPARAAAIAAARAVRAGQPGPASAAEKAARVERVKRDYEDITAKIAAEFAAAGTGFPGGVQAYLRQLALLEREKRLDLAAILTPRELEDFELRETNAGRLVQRWLGDTAATDEQRRAVFRLQREFDEKLALTLDVTPAGLYVRETARQETQEAVRAVLGNELFAAWLRADGPDYGNLVAFVTAQGLRPDCAVEVWQLKNDFIRRNLHLSADLSMPPANTVAARIATIEWARHRLAAILGPGALQAADPELFSWLPRG